MTTVRAEDRDGNVRLLTLDRPPANAIDESLLRDLSLAVREAQEDEAVRAIVITGAGKFFSGGLDLVAAMSRGDEQVPLFRDLFRDAFLELLTLPKPTIAAMNGHAIAGGLILALACDFRFAVDRDCFVGLNEVAIGASFPKVAFETARLRLTHGQATEVLLGAAIYPVTEGVRLGVVDKLLAPEALEETVLDRAARLAAFPREAYAYTKAALVAEAVERVKTETPEEAARGAAVWTTAESRAAMGRQLQRLGKQQPT